MVGIAVLMRDLQGFAGGAATVAGAVADVGQGILEVSADVLQLVPIAGLQEAARLVLKIWEAIKAVKVRTWRARSASSY